MSIATSTEANKEVVRRYYSLLDRQDFAAFAELLAPNYRVHVGGNPEPFDAQGMQNFAGAFFASLADLRHNVEGLFAEGDMVAARLTISGRHTGELMGVPATDKTIVFPALNQYRIESGKVVEQWVQFDAMGVLAQIGGLPQPAS